MFKSKTALLCLISAALALPLAAQPHAVLYTGTSWTDLGLLSGSNVAFAYGISPSGVVVGASDNGLIRGASQAFLYNGAMVSIPASGISVALGTYGSSVVGFTISPIGTSSSGWLYDGSTVQTVTCALDAIVCVPKLINSSGTIAGTFSSPTGTGSWSHAFVLPNPGSLMDVTPSAQWSEAHALNASGMVSGLMYSPGVTHAPFGTPFIWSSGTLQVLDCPPSLDSGAQCAFRPPAVLNDAGVLAVSLWGRDPSPPYSSHEYAFVYSAGTFTQIPFLGGDSDSYVGAISGSLVVGWSSPSRHPWQYTVGGSLVDLGLSKTGGGSWSGVIPSGVNASGQIVGTAEP